MTDECNKQVKGDPEKTLFVARLSHDTTEGKRVNVINSLITSFSRCFTKCFCQIRGD